MSKEAMKLALEALISYGKSPYIKQSHPKRWANGNEAIKALEEALANQEQGEPVAMRYDFDGYGYKYIDSGSGSDWQTRIKDAEPVYSEPQQRKPLTDDKMWALWNSQGSDKMNQQEAIAFAKAIEAAHGIKE